MKIDKRYKIEKCVSKDISRCSLSEVYLDGPSGMAIATDAHIIAWVPVSDVKKTENRYVTQSELDAARGKAVGAIPSTLDSKMHPDYNMTCVEPKNPRRVSLNVKLLRNLFDALGADVVTFTLSEDELDPVGVSPSDTENKARGLIMPCLM